MPSDPIEPPFDSHGRCVDHGRVDCPPCEALEMEPKDLIAALRAKGWGVDAWWPGTDPNPALAAWREEHGWGVEGSDLDENGHLR